MDVITKATPCTILEVEGDWWVEPVIDPALSDINGVALDAITYPQEHIMVLIANFPVHLIAVVEEVEEDEEDEAL